uniref:Separin n=1 Tax=Eptatretus burgeri TaxID=7764 RepID=A0A8C4NAB5_EPTBU
MAMENLSNRREVTAQLRDLQVQVAAVVQQDCSTQITKLHTVCDRLLRACVRRLGDSSLPDDLPGSIAELSQHAVRGFLLAKCCQTPLYLEKILYNLVKSLFQNGEVDAAVSLFQELLAGLLRWRPICVNNARLKSDYDVLIKFSHNLVWKAAAQMDLRPKALAVRAEALKCLVLSEYSGRKVNEEEKLTAVLPPLVMQSLVAILKFKEDLKHLTSDDLMTLESNLFSPLRQMVVSQMDLPNSQQQFLQFHLLLQQAKLVAMVGPAKVKPAIAVQLRENLKKLAVVEGPLLLAVDICYALLDISSAEPELQKVPTFAPLACRLKSLDCSNDACVLESCEILLFALELLIHDPVHDELFWKSGFSVKNICGLHKFLQVYMDLVQQEPAKSLRLGQSKGYLGLLVMLVDLQLPYLILTQRDAVDKVLDIAQIAVESFGAILVAQNGDDAKNQVFAAGAVAFNLSRSLLQQGLYSQAVRFGRLACRQAEHAFVLMPDKNRVLRYISLYVESCRRAGCYREGLQAVADGCWILRDDLQYHLPTLLTLWGQVKGDGVTQGNVELQLLTLADFLGHREPKRDFLFTVLQAELRHCKAQRGDTAQERYNIICDLLELSPEGCSQPLDRVHHLLEFTQLLCYRDYSSQTDCTALDCVEEVLRLLESLQEENVKALNPGHVIDLKAIAHLWLYIVHVEDVAAKAVEKDSVQEKVPVLELDNVNDLDAEEKQIEDPRLHSNLCFLPPNEAENLDLALELWRDVLSVIELETLYCPSTTLLSLQVLTQLFRLIGKPLQALWACQLVERLSEVMGNLQASVLALCQAATLLLELQVPSYAQLFVDKAEAELQRAAEAGEDLAFLQETVWFTQSYWLLSTGQMELGCQRLHQLLAEPSVYRPSKACYVLKAKAWMLASFYLNLPHSRLDVDNRQSLLQQVQVPTGESSALGLAVAAHRLLVGVVSLLLGSCYLRLQPADLLDADTNAPKANIFLPQGDSLVMKWSLLSELLLVTCHVATLQKVHGNNLEAMSFCQEALKLASKLQLSRRCAFLLVTKAGLEAQKGHFEDCSLDLCRLASFVNTDYASEARRSRKIARPTRLQQVGNLTEAQPDEESPNDDKTFTLPEPGQVIVRRHAAQPNSPNASPTLHRRVKPCGPWTHNYCCRCPWCSDPMYLWVAVEWACVQSCLEEADGRKTRLHILLKAHALVEKLVHFIHSKLEVMLGALPQHVCNGSQSEKPETCWALKAKVLYTLSCTELTLRSFCHLQEHAEMATKLLSLGVHDNLGLGSNLLLLRALSLLVRLSARHDCSLVELFSQFWGIGFMVEPLIEPQDFVSDIQKSEETQTVKLSAQRPSRTNKKPPAEVCSCQ